MIHERGLVLDKPASTENKVWVRTQRQSACDSCNLKSGCGQSALSKLSGQQSIEFEVTNVLQAQVGDVVIMSIPEEGILQASLVMYLVPLLLMVVSAMLAGGIGLSDPFVVMFGVVGLGLGFSFARHYSQKHKDDPRFSPVMTSLAIASPVGSACA